MFDVVLLIAGKGERAKLNYNKVFYKIKNKSIYLYALEKFINLKDCNKVVIVASENDLEMLKTELITYDSSKIIIVSGGLMRQDSVYNGVMACTSEIVLIHDGARPVITEKEILDIYHAVQEFEAAVLAVKTTDTIKEFKNGKVVTLDRTNLYNIQTPQGMKTYLYKKGFEFAKAENYYATDDVGLLEKYLNITPKIVLGNYHNIKVTTQEDLRLIEFLLEEK